jgi:Hypothetical protein (DUF2513)
MKRDMELIRALLLAIEALDSQIAFKATLKLKVDSTRKDMIDHLKLMIKAGFLDAKPIETQAGTSDIVIKGITNEGHNFLEDARNESIWKETMGLVQEKGGSVAIAVLTQLLSSVAKQHFRLS